MDMKNAIKMTDFTRKVMATVKKIPRGKVASYGQIARLAGKPGGARGVGWILNSMSEIHALPWQRVLNSQGKISLPPRSSAFLEQRRLLIKEGVVFLDRISVDLEKHQWKREPRTSRSVRSPRMFS